MHHPSLLLNSPSTLYSTSPVGKGASLVGRFVKRQAYILLLVGGISSGALLLVGADVHVRVHSLPPVVISTHVYTINFCLCIQLEDFTDPILQVSVCKWANATVK